MFCDHCKQEKQLASLPYRPYKFGDGSCGTIDLCAECLGKMLAQLTPVAADGAVAPIKCAECGDEILPICEACAGDMRRR